ncbi:MAG: 3-deoxy-D-manno-octulosonic acid transferase [Candidatus Omnitrophica bacterium]|nr:3-deoxy-D-manno-octulosonic acid transferase [Candidatus Omnitrophota bacterium]
MLYDIAFLIFSLFYLPALIFKGKMHRDFLQRFGKYDPVTLATLEYFKSAIWIQAVSVGEVALCKSLIPQLKERFPGRPIVLSTITKTGNDLAKREFSQYAAVIYFPLDLSFIARRVVNMVKPSVYIMVETEIWPGVLRELSREKVPSIIINGRISDRSFGKYKLARPFLKRTLSGISRFCMQSDLDAERIIEMGAAAGKVRITGSMKFDAAGDTKAGAPVPSVRLKPGEELFVAGSTHDGEEDAVISAYKTLTGEFPDLRLLVAPRHITRVADVEKAVRGAGFEPVRVSKCQGVKASDVLVLDTIGHLKDFYSVATLVFIGGSLVKHGGQNPIEPALFEKPIIFGPHMFNFKAIAASFVNNGGAVQVDGPAGLLEECRRLLRDKPARQALGANAKRTVAENRGATGKNIEAIADLVLGSRKE